VKSDILKSIAVLFLFVPIMLFISCKNKENKILPKLGIPGYTAKNTVNEKFDTDLSEWIFSGKGKASLTSTGSLLLLGETSESGIIFWYKNKINYDFLLEFEVVVNDSSGLCSIVICASDNKTETPELPSGNLNQYLNGINSYIIDFHKRTDKSKESSACVRKNPGYLLLSRIEKDPCFESRPYLIDIAKIGNRILLFVDGERIQDVRDKGGFGPAYNKGYFGFWIHGITDLYNITLDNVKVFKLIPQ